MGSLIKQFSIVGIVSQLIWALLLFSSFSVEHVLNGFGGLGPLILGGLALTSAIGWLLMVAFLFSNDEIENKTIWFVALLFLPGQFVFWIQFIHDADAIENMNDASFDRKAFLEEYQAEAKPVVQAPSKPALRRPRGLTPPAFMALDRKQPAVDSRPRL